jgi:predicted ATPase
MNNKKTIVTISGAIGVGKTEVLKHLQNIGYDLIPSVGKSGTAGIINNIQLNGPATENDVITDQH